MDIYEKLIYGHEKMSLIGLGYVGLPIAIAFANKVKVIGFDVNAGKIEKYKKGIDVTNEVGDYEISKTLVEFTSNEKKLKEAKFHIIAVPTPVRSDNMPDLSPVESASHILGKYLSRGSVVVYESTVYPGVTEEICAPILENESGLKCGIDFKIGYSPERINPGDKTHRLESIIKIVSGMDDVTLDTVAKVYSLVVKAGVYKAASIRVAEAAKVIENCQRDINIAFMNELSIIFHLMGIDTKTVLEAAGTKWNFLKFYPGLVGGHCIGVDPYYLTYKAETLGYHPEVILSGRRINDNMGKFIAANLVKKLIHANIPVKGSKVGILGLTFKENCPDIRNSKVVEIVNELMEYGINLIIVDPLVDIAEAKRLYGLQMKDMTDCHDVDAVVVAVAHEEFKNMGVEEIEKLYKKGLIKKVLFDVKGIYDKDILDNFDYWRL